MGSMLPIEEVETVRGSAGSAPRALLIPGARLWRSGLSWFKPTRARVSRDRYEGEQVIIRAKNEKCDCGHSLHRCSASAFRAGVPLGQGSASVPSPRARNEPMPRSAPVTRRCGRAITGADVSNLCAAGESASRGRRSESGLAEGGRDQLADRVLGGRLRGEIAEGEHQTAAGHGTLQILAVIEAVTLDLITIALGEPLAHIRVPIGHRVAGVLQGDDAAPVQLGEYGVQAVAVGHARPGLLGSGLGGKLGLDGGSEHCFVGVALQHVANHLLDVIGAIEAGPDPGFYAVKDVVIRLAHGRSIVLAR